MYGLPSGAFEIIYDIRQYGSDSVLIRQSRIAENGREFKSESGLAFNTVKRIETEPFDNMEITVICSVSPDGTSFTETTDRKSKIGLFTENRMKNTYLMTEDKNQLIIKWVYFPDVSSDQGHELADMVLERIREEE
jgi:hypothetical protein